MTFQESRRKLLGFAGAAEAAAVRAVGFSETGGRIRGIGLAANSQAWFQNTRFTACRLRPAIAMPGGGLRESAGGGGILDDHGIEGVDEGWIGAVAGAQGIQELIQL